MPGPSLGPEITVVCVYPIPPCSAQCLAKAWWKAVNGNLATFLLSKWVLRCPPKVSTSYSLTPVNRLPYMANSPPKVSTSYSLTLGNMLPYMAKRTFQIWLILGSWDEEITLNNLGGPTVIRRVYREEGRQERQRRKRDDREVSDSERNLKKVCGWLLRLRKVPKEECRIECPQKPKWDT